MATVSLRPGPFPPSILLAKHLTRRDAGTDGEKTAMFVKNTLPDWLQRRRDAFHSDRKNTLVTLFRNMNDALCEDSRIDTYMSGTTAAVVFVWTSSRRLTIAHVGDSRVVAGRRNPDGTMRAEQITK